MGRRRSVRLRIYVCLSQLCPLGLLTLRQTTGQLSSPGIWGSVLMVPGSIQLNLVLGRNFLPHTTIWCRPPRPRQGSPHLNMASYHILSLQRFHWYYPVQSLDARAWCPTPFGAGSTTISERSNLPREVSDLMHLMEKTVIMLVKPISRSLGAWGISRMTQYQIGSSQIGRHASLHFLLRLLVAYAVYNFESLPFEFLGDGSACNWWSRWICWWSRENWPYADSD